MPILKSAKKALRTSRRKEKRNAAQKKLLKEALRSVNEKNVNAVMAKIDKAAKNSIIHTNKADRLKSRLAKLVGKTPKADKPAPAKKTKAAAKKSTGKKAPAKKKA